MVPESFLFIFILSILLNYLHGVECIKTKFYVREPNFYFFTRYFKDIPQSVYFVFHGSFWLFIFLILFFLKGGNWIIIPLGLYGTIFFTEFHHFLKGVRYRKYYPGMITSFFFPILGIFYWIELLKLWK